MTRSKRSHRIPPFPGLTLRQSDAIRRINTLSRGLFEGDAPLSYLTLKQSGERITEMEGLLSKHFGLTLTDFVAAKARTETRPLAG